jgi:hypothetical protein
LVVACPKSRESAARVEYRKLGANKGPWRADIRKGVPEICTHKDFARIRTC